MTPADFGALDRAGLTLQAVFDIDAFPAAIRDKLRDRFDPEGRYRQLILIGHAGRTLWERVKAVGSDSLDPIDDFSVATVDQWFAGAFPGHERRVIYPGDPAVDLLALGRLAGWHHPSPFMIGIQEEWGTWFAYRVAMLADTAILPTPPRTAPSPCVGCSARPCAAACPADAVSDRADSPGGFALDKCIAYRRLPDSPCRATCLARVSCPVGARHRYDEDQLRHTYSISLKAIETYC